MLTIQQITSELKALKSMSDLSPERFAEEDGLAESFVRQIRGDLKTTQLQKVFHQVKNLKLKYNKSDEEFNRGQIALIMPTLAYSVGRGYIPKEFYDLMKICFGSEKCKTKADFNSAADFLEAIMAYHKYVTETDKNRKEKL